MLCPYIDSVVLIQVDQGNENRHPRSSASTPSVQTLSVA